MTASEATSGFGCLLQRGDGGVNDDAVQASRTISTSNQQVIFYAKTPGVAGNSKTVAILVSGVSTSFSLSVSETAIVVTSATDGSSLATTTVNELLYQLMQNDTFAEHWEATRGAGNGTGVLAAATAAALTSGADATQEFVTVSEVKSLSGPTTQSQVIDVTHMESDDNTREFLPTLIDPGEMSFVVNLKPGSVGHKALRSDQKTRVRRDWRLQFTDADLTTWEFSGYVTQFGVTAEIESALEANCTIKLTSWPEELA